MLACTKGHFYSQIQAILTVERRIDSQMRFQIILAFEIIAAHSPVFVQDEVIYWLEPGKSGRQLQRQEHVAESVSPCQGNFGRVQNCYETLISIQAEKSLKRLVEAGHTASVDRWSFWQGTSTQKQTESWKDAHINKARTDSFSSAQRLILSQIKAWTRDTALWNRVSFLECSMGEKRFELEPQPRHL